MGDLQFSPFEFEDLDSLSQTYELCFGKKAPDNYFRWKFMENPAGKVFGYVAKDDATTAGFYGVIPELYKVNGQEHMFFQSMDTMTHPEYRRQGLFTKLAQMTYEGLEERDPNVCILGFPGDTSLPGFVNKLNWKLLKRIPYIFLPRILSKQNRNSAIQIDPINSFGEEFEEYCSRHSELPIQKVLDRDILNWRICSHPMNYKIIKISRNNELKGYVVYHIEPEGRCFIVLIDLAEDVAELLGAACGHIFQNTKTRVIFTWQPGDQDLRAAYRANRFLKNPFGKGPFSYKPPFIVYSKQGRINGCELFDYDNYDVQPILRDY